MVPIIDTNYDDFVNIYSLDLFFSILLSHSLNSQDYGANYSNCSRHSYCHNSVFIYSL